MSTNLKYRTSAFDRFSSFDLEEDINPPRKPSTNALRLRHDKRNFVHGITRTDLPAEEQVIIPSNEILRSIREQLQLLSSNDSAVIISALGEIREHTTSVHETSIEFLVSMNLVGYLHPLLDRQDNPELQKQTLIILINLTDARDPLGEVVGSICFSPCTDKLVALLSSPDIEIRSLTAKLIDGISYRTGVFRNHILSLHVVTPLLTNLQIPDLTEKYQISFLNALESLSIDKWRLPLPFQHESPPHNDEELIIINHIPFFVELLSHHSDEVSRHALAVLFEISYRNLLAIQKLASPNLIKAIIMTPQLSPESNLARYKCKVLGAFTSVDDNFTQILLDCGIISYLQSLIDDKHYSAYSDVLWMLANISLGPFEHGCLVLHSGILQSVLREVDSLNDSVRKKISILVCTLFDKDTRYFEPLLQMDVIPFLLKELQSTILSRVDESLSAFHSFVRAAKLILVERKINGEGPEDVFAGRFKSEDGIPILEDLIKEDDDADIQQRTSELLFDLINFEK
ncbi:hypothetical protein BLNAU_12851 [Blattamonas nauphoetae]|uniref:Importin subunit alpha n=1 Tax=Blattamonas nauphoetae TaxID=2049346 RepID=A0ABQ9XI86_9EUKA|nr:hypothetical protein BLNAU_12851 [Blattamonas nauphoetae]